ncbi:MOSC domain-containing protein [Aspergillus spectabilis]
MKISQIYIYPIKSLRGIALPSAQVTRTGFKYDRRFMLLKVIPASESEIKDGSSNSEPTLKNMHVPHFPEMALFQTEIVGLDNDGDNEGRIRVTYHSPDFSPSDSGVDVNTNGNGDRKETIEIPLTPSTRGLEELAIIMHKSPTKGYNMGADYNAWFSECFGYEVVLAYLGGGNSRPVLGTFAPRKHVAHKDRVQSNRNLGVGLVAAVLTVVLGVGATTTDLFTTGVLGVGVVVALGGLALASGLWKPETKDERITFSDTAPYMVVSETSVTDVSGRLEGEEIDVRKFRANIIVEGAKTAFEEDFWAELVVGDSKVRLLLTANCVRCRSLDVDYSTGKMGTGESGKVLKKLMSDRRVDTGAKYSPVFGRYGFLGGQSESKTVRVGDEVVVASQMKERAVHDWPGLS